MTVTGRGGARPVLPLEEGPPEPVGGGQERPNRPASPFFGTRISLSDNTLDEWIEISSEKAVEGESDNDSSCGRLKRLLRERSVYSMVVMIIFAQ